MSAQSTQPINILIIDDDEIDRMIYMENLSRSNTNYQVFYALSAAEGLKACETKAPDCILLDYNLPDQSGIDVLKTLSKNKALSSIPILMFTGQGAEQVAVEALKNGAKDYIVKNDITPEGLERAINNAIEKQILENKIQLQKTELSNLAYHDSLTSLLNRFSFKKIFESNLATAQRNNQSLALLFMDLDHFKLVNDTLGHQKGDILLKLVAKKISNCLRKGDVLARFGGDEFVVGLNNVKHIRDISIIAEKLITSIGGQYDLEGKTANIGASIGIALFPRDGKNIDELIQCADQSMYAAKNKKRNTYCFYSENLQNETMERVKLEGALREELYGGNLFLNYQPQYDLLSGKIIGFEALLRCDHPQYGLLSPEKLVAIAHDIGIMQDLGKMIVHQALKDYKTLLNSIDNVPRISINASPKELLDPNYFNMFQKALIHNDVPPQSVEIEITESFIIEHAAGLNTLAKLRDLGIKFSIDDFGTGFSSLTQLKEVMPIHEIKIDKSFVQSMNSNKYDYQVVKSIIDIGHNFGLAVVAEGVEFHQHASALTEMNCKIAQGYLFSKPLPLSKMKALLS